jgi:hypothetical protein
MQALASCSVPLTPTGIPATFRLNFRFADAEVVRIVLEHVGFFEPRTRLVQQIFTMTHQIDDLLQFNAGRCPRSHDP